MWTQPLPSDEAWDLLEIVPLTMERVAGGYERIDAALGGLVVAEYVVIGRGPDRADEGSRIVKQPVRRPERADYDEYGARYAPTSMTVDADPRVVLYDANDKPLIRKIGYKP